MIIPDHRARSTSPRGALPILTAAAAFWLGTVLGISFSCNLAIFGPLILLFTALSALLSRRLGIGPSASYWFLIVGLSAGAGLLGGSAGSPRSGPLVRKADHAEVTGTVRRVEHLHWGRRILVDLTRIDGEETSIRARLSLSDSTPALRSGDVILGRARLHPPYSPANPGAFDAEALLLRQGIGVIGRVDRVSRIESGPARLDRRLDIARQRVREATNRAARRWVSGADSDRVARVEGVLRALSLGEGGAVAPEVRERFATAGLAHLLAISGLHIGLIAAGLFALLLRLLLRSPGGRQAGPVAAVLMAPVVGLLVTWVDHPASGARAGLMALILLGAVVLRRRLCPWSSLAAVAMGLLVLQPQLALRPGFQLSFAAVAGLLAMAGRLRSSGPAVDRRARAARRLRMMCEVTLAAALATAPLCALHFGVVPLSGNIANLVGVPLTSLLLPCIALAASATLIAGEAADLLWLIPTWLAHALLIVAEAASSFPLASTRVEPPGLVALFGSALGIWFSIRATRTRSRVGAAALVILPLLAPTWFYKGSPPGAPLEVFFLSVGHGDSTLVRTRTGDVLVDGGRGASNGRDAGRIHVVPALRALGVRRLAAVVVSHPHDDHYGGLVAVFEAFEVKELFHSGLYPSDREPYENLLATATSQGTALRIACSDPMPDLRPVEIRCLHPRGSAPFSSHLPDLSSNDNSIVLSLVLGNHVFLLPGDIEAGAETLLVRDEIDLRATVVKAPHHGSRTSSSAPFVAATEASHVVFSSAASSPRFDFPAAEVADRWQAAGAKLWWTHHHGALRFRSDGDLLEVEPFRRDAVPWPDRKSVQRAGFRTTASRPHSAGTP